MGNIIRNLSILAYANGHTHWHYKMPPALTADAVQEPRHFAEAGDMLAPGDVITATGPHGGAMLLVQHTSEAGIYVVPMFATRQVSPQSEAKAA